MNQIDALDFAITQINVIVDYAVDDVHISEAEEAKKTLSELKAKLIKTQARFKKIKHTVLK